MNAQNVSAGKPTGGAISVAPLGTTLPTGTAATLDTAFKSLGYISDQGLVNANTPTNTDIKAWGGDTVLSIQSEKSDTFRFKLIETKNIDVLKTVYGDDNVTEADGETTIKANAKEAEYNSYVVDMIMKGGTLKRVVIPAAKITTLADITYTDNDPVGYEVTITAVPDTAGNTHYEYIK